MAYAPADQQRKLLDLAQLDAQIARLDTRNLRHPLREELARLLNEQARHGREKDEAELQHDQARRALDEAEKPVADLQEHIAVKDAQLASGMGLDSRGLLALQEEIAGLRAMLEHASDKEFEALTALEEAEEKRRSLEQDIDRTRDVILARKAELEDAVSEIETEKKKLTAQRAGIFAALDENLRDIYTKAKEKGGYAVLAMKADGQTDAGLSLSPVEADRVRNAPEDEICISEDYDCIIVRI